MLSIGEFSLVSHLSVKTLRYYHELGILTPSKIDSISGYRYYDSQNRIQAERISTLKEMGFHLSEIQEILQRCPDISTHKMKPYLDAKEKEFSEKIEELQALRDKIKKWETKVSAPRGQLLGPIRREKIPQISFLYVQIEGYYSEIGRGFSQLFKHAGDSIAGPCFALYQEMEYHEGPARFRACAPGSLSRLSGDIGQGRMDEGTWMCLQYKGPYQGLGLGYQTLLEEIHRSNSKALPPIQEIYLKGPGEVEPENYITELRIRIN